MRRLTLFLAHALTYRIVTVGVRSRASLPTLLQIAEDTTGLKGEVVAKFPRRAYHAKVILVAGTRWRGAGVAFPRELTREERHRYARAVGEAFRAKPRLADRPLGAFVLIPVGAFFLGLVAVNILFT